MGRDSNARLFLHYVTDGQKEKVEHGKGTTDHLMPLGYLLFNLRLGMFLICSYFLRYFSFSVLISRVLTQRIACVGEKGGPLLG